MIYTFKPVITDGVAPEGTLVQRMQCAKKGVFFQCVTMSCQTDSDDLIVGDEVLIEVKLDEIPEVQRLKHRAEVLLEYWLASENYCPKCGIWTTNVDEYLRMEAATDAVREMLRGVGHGELVRNGQK